MTMHEALTELSQAMRGDMKTLREQFNAHREPNLGTDGYTTLWHIAKQMDALLDECKCAFKHISGRTSDMTIIQWAETMGSKLKQAGYGNDTDR